MVEKIDNNRVLPTKLDDINEKSEAANEILGHIPHWIIRWGITVFFFALLSLLTMSYIIRYPEIITAKVYISTTNPSVPVIARTSGNIQKLNVKEGDVVKKDTVLAIIENTVELKDYLTLITKLQEFDKSISLEKDFLHYAFNRNFSLGNLQNYYWDFLDSFSNYKSFIHDNYYATKIESLVKQLSEYKKMSQILKNQEQISQQELKLEKNKYESNYKLFKEGLLSTTELNQIQTGLLIKEKALNSAKNNVVQNSIQLNELKKQKYELEYQLQDKQRILTLRLRTSFKKLFAEINQFEQTYILKAPIEGIVSFFNIWSENQYVKVSEEVMTISPKSLEISAKAYVQSYGAGKIKLGQKINIKLNDYPYTEFGMVSGTVKSISPVSRKGKYLIYIELPNKLKTSYGKNLQFKQNMEGEAEIITDKLRLIERILGQLRHILKSNFTK